VTTTMQSNVPPAIGPDRDARTRRARLTKIILWGLAAAFFVFSALQLRIVPERLLQAWDRGQFMLNRMLPPVFEDPPRLAAAAVETIQVAIVGTVFGVVLSAILAIFAARNVSPLGPLSWTIKAFAAFVRAVPSLVWALLFIVAVGLGPTPGILALAINSTGMLVKAYAENIEELPMGPIEALRASGASSVQIAFQAILPSIMHAFIAWSVFRFDINLRYAAILGIVGAGGIGWELTRATQVGRYDIALGVTFIIFILVMSAELFAEWLQRRSDLASTRATA
jgi:phosphonate transport system permease protein